MYLIKITGTNRYYRRLGNQVHQYVGIEDATVFRKWKQAKQKADILNAAISPIGEQVNFEVKQHKFYVLKNQNDKGYMNQISWNAPKEEAKLFTEKEMALKEAEEIAVGMAKVGIDVEFAPEEI
ncbi:N-acetylmuramoyl-L-alanine amidase [Pediococcus acidilactici]|uniref:N-acetylmuramoyl-L-alanine amidase n=1 Tax=Pediococcus acidilactici TaxID=1254 RepID=UPI00132176C8|nr:N-acetylmuramoyl-L-alanine amidase [Pediococcus acidilactici]KAF0339760.1 N-acetylmuramoyl-L-alanine amidase [Pediococcus acidilactici]KAF0379723.1 N-acetylmuramoyl-L-alanine amidase [Pediococcus acidilactici]KAF0388410.1 N-acetylmuramoyl-L-alanine amidase [Pediococcus acidilactici]KAF0452963.1 N-acetylmuramoyl-L-alanine amidase [Pediococcus acidilactici]KAF0462242.1 N-acetylmuramoyl-L-alanine amidase [Pediococcus acidilactici]